jgi:hypothetical protein
MRVSRITTLVAAGALALVGVLTGSAPASAAGTGSISGYLASSNFIGQAGVTVTLEEPITGVSTGLSTVTDEFGNWTLDPVPEAEYVVHYSGPIEGYADNLVTLDSATPYFVPADSSNFVYDVISSITVPPNYSVTVVGSDGAPISLCPRFYPADNPDSGPFGDFCTTTDGVTTGIQTPGAYLVEFLDYDGNYADTWIGTDGTRATATPVTIPAAGSGDFGTVVMPVASHITVTIDAADTGAAIDGNNCITAFAGRTQDYGSNGCSDATSDTITVNGLRAGTYTLQADTSNLDYVGRWSGNAASQAKATLVTVAAGQSVTAPGIVLPRGGVITGRVTDKKTGKGIEGICASTGRWSPLGREDGTRQFGDSCTDADGRYRIRGLDNGRVKIQFVPGTGAVPPITYALAWYDGTNHSNAESIPTKLGRTVKNIDVALSPEGTISGTAVDPSGNAVPGFVWAEDFATGYSLSYGEDYPGTEFRIGYLPTTSVLLHWDSPSGTRYWDGTRTGTANRAKAVPIKTKAGQAITGLKILVK